MSYYLQTSRDTLVQACCKVMSHFPLRKSLLSKATDLALTLALDGILSYDAAQLKVVVCAAHKKQLLESLCAKPLHGKFYAWTQSSTINVA